MVRIFQGLATAASSTSEDAEYTVRSCSSSIVGSTYLCIKYLRSYSLVFVTTEISFFYAFFLFFLMLHSRFSSNKSSYELHVKMPFFGFRQSDFFYNPSAREVHFFIFNMKHVFDKLEY